MNYTFTYDDKNRLVKLSVDIDGKTQELSIKYENQKISFNGLPEVISFSIKILLCRMIPQKGVC